jgi:hypothetical protein
MAAPARRVAVGVPLLGGIVVGVPGFSTVLSGQLVGWQFEVRSPLARLLGFSLLAGVQYPTGTITLTGQAELDVIVNSGNLYLGVARARGIFAPGSIPNAVGYVADFRGMPLIGNGTVTVYAYVPDWFVFTVGVNAAYLMIEQEEGP